MPAATEGRRPDDGERNARYLHIYLADHMAGSLAGYELAKRCASSNKGTELGDYLENTFIPELREDRDALRSIMQRLGASGSRIKDGLAWAGEKVARLKLNGEITRYSPLSRVWELEGLTLGVRGKLCGWEALRDTVGSGPQLAGIDLDELIERAQRQHTSLEHHRRQAAIVAFGAS